MDTNEKWMENSWVKMKDEEIEKAYDFSKGYIDFLSAVKTEREAVDYIEKISLERGFKRLEEYNEIKPGDKVFISSKGKVAALAVIGSSPMEEGFNLIASHVDSPRLDLKARPAYEADGMSLFKTHYYGGIKKYQWVSRQLAMHGVVVKKDGKIINVVIGENESDPVFTITDLLPHLAKDQLEKKMSEAITAENLNILVGSRPGDHNESDPIKKQILGILKEKYNIEESDLISAELEMVPSGRARDVGLDRSMIGAYGQDDRVSAFSSLMAVMEIEKPARTALCLFVDKEEIGSTGNTGLESLLIENIYADLIYKAGKNNYFDVRKGLACSYALSADVNAAIDPNYPDVFEKMNCSFLSNGVVLTKYTGSRGKAGSNDANPEFVAKIRNLFDNEGVVWQVGELGKVDIGGGGTVAQYMARYGMEVVDCGVALLGMHAPMEIASKADVYMAYKAYKAFMQKF